MTTAIATTTIQSPHGAIFVRASIQVNGAAGDLTEDAERAVTAAAAQLEAMIAAGSWTRPMGEAREEYRQALEGEIDTAAQETAYAWLLLMLTSAADAVATEGWHNQGTAFLCVDVE